MVRKNTAVMDWKPGQTIFFPFLNTVNYRCNVTDRTLKKLRYIRFYVIPVLRKFCKNTQNCVISVYRFNVMLVKTQNYLISVYRCKNMLVKTSNIRFNASLFAKT